ncbi:MAG: acyl-CoA dehydrogenase family protein [Defluviicoccus sp.]|nr:acyl-CoA dehydrogenase family protein [Defluviicoccus sp.]MDE0382921.1 acyl-CoA dehydrogenase family protein [Defluviicoccus sp.]
MTDSGAEAILNAARAMTPELRTRASATEANRKLLPETHRAFLEAGFYRVMQPRGFGGLELPFGIQTDLSMELARACPSSAWVAALLACHGWLLGMMSSEVQAEVWGDAPETCVATSFHGNDIAVERASGGWRISGRWPFSSGVDYCGWAMLVAKLPSEDGSRGEIHYLTVPLSDCRIADTWNATGLAGTGSNDIAVEEAFVPDHRVAPMLALCKGEGPGRAVNPGYLYRLPQMAVFSFNLVGVAVGAARGAMEQLCAGLRQTSRATGAPLASQQSIQLRVAESMAEIDAAWTLVDRNRREIIAWAEADAVPAVAERVRYRRDNAFAAMACCRAIERVQPILGGRGLAAGDPVNRAWRDANAVARHVALTWDLAGAVQGAVALGLPCPDPLV